MERLLEHEIFAAVLGETVDLDHLNKISVHNGKGYGSYSDCDEFIISQVDYCEDPDLSKLFKITDSIKKRWKENSIDFRIYLYLNDMKIIGGHVFKYRELSQSGHFRPTGYETDPTQQELQIVKRLLSYIAEAE